MRYIFSFICIIALVLCCSCGGGTSASLQSNIETTPSVVTAPSIVITPLSVNVAVGGVQQFVATVSGLANTAVLWSVQEGATGGTIDTTGKYTAPMTLGTYHVIAQSQANLSVSASAMVTVTTPGEAQGFYTGTFTFGDSTMYVIVPPNDKFYAVYRDSNDEEWMMAGQGTSNEGNYSANLTNYWWDSGTAVTLTAAYVPQVSLAGSVVVVANKFNLGAINATAPPISSYDYNSPANLTEIVGTWSTGTEITITDAGRFTGNQGGCTFFGTITPDPNKNFYTVTFTYGDTCYSKNQTGSGVAVVTSVPDGTTHTMVLAVVVGDWYFSFVATR